MGVLDKAKDKVTSFFSSDKDKSEKSEKSERRRSIVTPPSSLFSHIDPILCSRSTQDPASLKKATQPTPRVIRRGSQRLSRSRKNATGNSIAFMSTTSSVSFAGPVINYQYEFKLKYGNVPNAECD